MNPRWPELPLVDWQDTRTTFHLFCQIVGKVRLKHHPKLNHWWHVPLYVTPRGVTTAVVPAGDKSFELELDLTDHTWTCRTSDGEWRVFPLAGQSVAGFYRRVTHELEDLGIEAKILAKPFDPDKAKSDIPFAEDEQHKTYDPEYAHRFFQVLSVIDPVFKEFRGRFLGKVSPVHLFWHSLDLAVTRFSGRSVEVSPDADPVTREAYSHEVISSGFWAGDDNIPEPAFYTYAAPEPEGLADEPLAPAGAWWQEIDGGTHMALLKYHELREMDDPRQGLLDFLQSSYEAGARRAGWDREALELR